MALTNLTNWPLLFKLHEICSVDFQKITKSVATRCQILRLKCTKFDFGWGSAPDASGGAYSAAPGPLAGFEGATSKGGEGSERGGEETGGEGGEGRGEEAFLIMWTRRLSALYPPLLAPRRFRCSSVTSQASSASLGYDPQPPFDIMSRRLSLSS